MNHDEQRRALDKLQAYLMKHYPGTPSDGGIVEWAITELERYRRVRESWWWRLLWGKRR